MTIDTICVLKFFLHDMYALAEDDYFRTLPRLSQRAF